ncbi:MAG: hypothetical protein ACI8S6_004454 [Myxococcota bacterium]
MGRITEVQLITLPDGRAIAEVNCEIYAYQGTYTYAWADGPRPILDSDGDQLVVLGIPFLDPATGELKWLQKSRGPGDCGSFYRYALEGDHFRELEHRSRECDDSSEEVPPPDEWPLVGAGEGHCAAGESVFFSCSTNNSKVLSLCGSGSGSGSRVQYRFGPLGNPELVYPPDSRASAFSVAEESTVRAQATVASVSNGDVTYKVTDSIGGGGGPDAASNNFQGVYVYQNDKLLATVGCTGEPETDWAALQAIVP